MNKILTFNNIAAKGLDCFPREGFEVASEIQHPDAIMLRSQNLHEYEFPETVKAVARAGAGVNNIPVERLSLRGIPVFNAPGANANAVKELVIAGILIACRQLDAAQTFVKQLQTSGAELERQIEAGKKQFVGSELPGRTLGVIGLGSIGVLVANTASALGMKVIGFDPSITVERAWQLDADVKQAKSVREVVATAEFITVHVPLIDATKNLVNEQRIKELPKGAVVLNFARSGIVDEKAVLEALGSGQLSRYVTDFPSRELLDHEKVVNFPHLGASTREAEENCAVMVAENLRDYLENGNIKHSVNFPNVHLSRASHHRVTLVNLNRPDMLGQISHQLGVAGINILHMVNESRGELAYTLIDTDRCPPQAAVKEIESIDGLLKMRCLNTPG